MNTCKHRHSRAQNASLKSSVLTAMSQRDRCQFQLPLRSQVSQQPGLKKKKGREGYVFKDYFESQGFRKKF